MNQLVRNTYRHILGLIILASVLTACATAAAEQQPTAVPTALPPTEVSSLTAALTANENNVTVQNEAGVEQTLAKFETSIISSGDRIKLDDQGRGLLSFGNRNEISLIGSVEIILDELKIESGGSISTTVKQIAGHTHVKLNEQSAARVTLETADSTITTIGQGSDFTVCFKPETLTCIAVQVGPVEVISQSEKRILQSGEAIYYTPGQPPPEAICMQEDNYIDWLAQMEIGRPEEFQTLGQLVQSWPQEACPSEIPTTAAVIEENTATPTVFLAATATEIPPTPTLTATAPPTNTARPIPTSTSTSKPKPKEKSRPTLAPP